MDPGWDAVKRVVQPDSALVAEEDDGTSIGADDRDDAMLSSYDPTILRLAVGGGTR